MDKFRSSIQKQHVILKNKTKSFMDFYNTPSWSHISVSIQQKWLYKYKKCDSILLQYIYFYNNLFCL